MTVRWEGSLLPDPLRISLTNTVPEDVPSLFHNSIPLVVVSMAGK